MEDNSSRNVLVISATVIALGALAYLMTEKEAMVEKFVPLPSVVPDLLYLALLSTFSR